MVWPTGNIDASKFDADSDSISASRPELYKIALAVNEIANTGPSSGNGTPGGSSLSVQYNNAGSFGGIGTVDAANGKITVTALSANTISGFKYLTGNGYTGGGGGTIEYTTYVGTPAVSFSNGDSGAGHSALRIAAQDVGLQVANLAGNVNTVIYTNGNISTTGTVTAASFNTVSQPGILRVANSFATGNQATTQTEIISLSVLIPANTFAAGDVIEIYHQYNTTAGTNENQCTATIYVNTSNTIGGSSIDSDLIGDVASKHYRLRTSVDVITANGNTRGFIGGGAAQATTSVFEGTGYGQDSSSPSPATFSINWTTNQYIIFATKQNDAGDTADATCVGYQIYRR